MYKSSGKCKLFDYLDQYSSWAALASMSNGLGFCVLLRGVLFGLSLRADFYAFPLNSIFLFVGSFCLLFLLSDTAGLLRGTLLVRFY